MTFDEWLESARELQTDTFDYNFERMHSVELSEYVRWNVLAAIKELTELLDETHWKPWSALTGVKSAEHYKDELVDALHFIANLAQVVRWDEGELDQRYEKKDEVIRARQASGIYQ